jgi:putative hydrolase of the HAD superfamily
MLSDSRIPERPVQIVTFDFHNTVAHCDPWFDLEIRELPAAVLRELARAGHVETSDALEADATTAYRALRALVMESGVEKDAQTCVEEIFAELAIEVPPEAIAPVIERLMRGCLVDLSPVPGAVETISTLIDRDVPVGIVSSAVYHPFLEWALAEFGLLERLAFVATSASIGFYKSDPRIYHHAYDLAKATIRLGVHIGDSPRWDIATAQQAGLGTVLYTAPGTKRPELPHDIEPDLILDSLVGADAPILALLGERHQDTVIS